MSDPDDAFERYELRSPVGGKAGLFLAGGAAALVVGVALFAVQLMLPAEKAPPFPVTIGSVVIPSLIGLGMLGYGLHLRRTVTAVDVRAGGLTVHTAGGGQDVPWDDVSRVDDDKLEYPVIGVELDAVVLYDRSGAKLATFTSQLRGFKRLAARVKAEARGRGGVAGGHARAKRNKLMAVVFLGFAAFMLFAAGFIARDTWYEATHSTLLRTEGVVVEADVVKHEIFHVTPRVEYRFTDETGVEHTRGTPMTRAAWDALAGEPVVEVVYVRSNPEYSRLLVGEVEGGGGPSVKAPWGYLLAAAAAVMSLFMAFVGVLRWFGWDIDVGKDGVKWVKYGEAPDGRIHPRADPDER